MTRRRIPSFDRMAQSTNIWIRDVMEVLKTNDRRSSYAAVRAVLQTLRDRLSVDEVAHFGAQLPTLLRGVYYDGWRPASAPKKLRHLGDFLARVASRLPRGSGLDPARAVDAVMQVIVRHVDFGEVEDVRRTLPADLRPIVSGTKPG